VVCRGGKENGLHTAGNLTTRGCRSRWRLGGPKKGGEGGEQISFHGEEGNDPINRTAIKEGLLNNFPLEKKKKKREEKGGRHDLFKECTNYLTLKQVSDYI